MDVTKSAPTDSRTGKGNVLRKRWPLIALVAILIMAGVAAIIAAQGAFRNMMNPTSLSKAQFDAVAPGGQVEVVFEITVMPSDKLLVGNFLDPASGGAYRRTADTLNVALAADTSVVMGQLSDVKPGAVIQIRGQRTDA